MRCWYGSRRKIDKENYRVYTILGDGEIEEGQVWEAAMFAGNHHLDNLTAFVDYNGLQIDGTIDEVNSAYPIAESLLLSSGIPLKLTATTSML